MKGNFDINSDEEYREEYNKSISSPGKFWEEKANRFQWKKKWRNALEWNFTTPSIRWFIDGKLNITENCIDRHLAEYGNRTAFIWEPNNPGEHELRISYNELYLRVSRFANVLKNHGVKKGESVCIYLPMIPELPVAMLACARIGAIHSVVYGGFSAGALANRINDSTPRILITADGGFRGDKIIPLKNIADEALSNCPSVEKVIVVKRTGAEIQMARWRDEWWDE